MAKAYEEIRDRLLPKEVQEAAQRKADKMLAEIRLNELRKAMGVTQTELAKRLGVSQPAIVGFESGGDILIGTLMKWADGVGVRLRISADLPDGQTYPLLGDTVEVSEDA